MGADAELFIFDYDRYVQEVVPAFHRLLLDGELEPWLRQFVTDYLQRLHYLPEEALAQTEQLTRLRGTDLRRHCTVLAADLGFAVEPGDRHPELSFQWSWAWHACQSQTCPDRGCCPFHSTREPAPMLPFVFEEAVKALCLGPSQFMGRNTTPADYTRLLDERGVAAAAPVRGLLDALGMRGFLLGYQFAGDAEGIHGWLGPAETGELVEGLTALDLPPCEPSFEAMNVLHQKARRNPAVPWMELSLAFARTVGFIALQKGQGVLWRLI